MPRCTPYLAALVLAGVAVAASGCLGTPTPDPHPVIPSSAAAIPSPTATPAKEDLVTALEKLASAPFKYHVKSNLPAPTGGNVDATGAYDHAAKTFEEHVTLTGTSTDGTLHRIVFGIDSYSRTRETDKWVHLDLARLKSQVLVGINIDDPTGLSRFITTITEATRSGPRSFKGRFDPMSKEQFLPIGYPNVVAFYAGTAPFTVETDDQGNVTSIHIELTLTDKPKFDMTTTFADHGKPLTTRRPAKNNIVEADDVYYK